MTELQIRQTAPAIRQTDREEVLADSLMLNMLFGCQMLGCRMLTESRKRRRSCEELQVLPHAKRSGSCSFLPEAAHDVWDSESSSSDSSAISSPERITGVKSTIHSTDQRGFPEHPAESSSQNNIWYHHINCILREAHFSSLQTRAQHRPT